jgi:hypothetical protein
MVVYEKDMDVMWMSAAVAYISRAAAFSCTDLRNSHLT